MDNRDYCCVKPCHRICFIGRLCEKHNLERFCLRVRIGIEGICGNLDNFEQKCRELWGESLNAKDLACVFSFWRISYNFKDVQEFIRAYTKNNDETISVNMIANGLKSTFVEKNENFNFLPCFTEEKLEKNDLETEELEEDWRNLLRKSLQNEFFDQNSAFKAFTHSKTLKFFQFSRMLSHYKIVLKESEIKEFLFQFSRSLELTESDFKKIWLNKYDLCQNTNCNVTTFSNKEYCFVHYSLICNKGKVLLNEIFKALNKKLQNFIKAEIFSMANVCPFKLKTLFLPYLQFSNTNLEWKYITEYVLSSLSLKRRKNSSLNNFKYNESLCY